MGYEFVTSYQHFIVYASKKETEKLHTDEKIEKELIEKTRKRQIRLRILIPLTLILFMIIIMQSNRLFFLTISNNGILFMMMGLFLFMIGWFCYSYSIGKRKKKEMNAELRHIHLRSILGVLGNLFVIVYLLGCVYLFSYQMQMVIIFAVLLLSQFLFRFGIVNLSSQKEGKMKYLLMIINFIFFFIIYYQALESMNRLHEPVAYVTEKRTSYLHTESILLKNDQGKADYQNGYVYYDYYERRHHFIISYITSYQRLHNSYGFQTTSMILKEKNSDYSIYVSDMDSHQQSYCEYMIKDDDHILKIYFDNIEDEEKSLYELIEQLNW